MAKVTETKIIFSAIDRVSSKMKKIGDSFAPLNKKINSVGQNFQSLGARMSLAGGAGLAAGFVGLLKPAMDFQTAMAGVYKVLSPEEMGMTEKAFADHIHSLVPVLKRGSIDIASAFQAGAQAGITSFEELNKFAELNTRMMATFDMSMYESSRALKTFRAQTGDLKQAEELMDTVNMLGKSFNVTERELTDFLQRSLGLGNIGGLVKESTAGLGAALINLGVAPDLASTAFEKMAGRLNLGTAAAKEQRLAMQRLGLSTEQTAKDMQRDGAGTILNVMKKITDEIPRDKQYAMIKGLFGLEGIKPILGLMQSDKTMADLKKAINMSLNSEGAQGQSYDEWLRITSTTSNKLLVAQEKFFSLRAKLGDMLLPTFEKFINIFEKFVDGWDKLTPKMKDGIAKILTITGILTAGGTAAGIFSFAIGGLLRVVAPLAGVVSSASVGLSAMAAGASKAGQAMSLLLMPMTGMTQSRQHALLRKTSFEWGNLFTGFKMGAKSILSTLGTLGRLSIVGAALGYAAYKIYKNWDQIVEAFSAFKKGFLKNEYMANAFDRLGEAFSRFSGSADQSSVNVGKWNKAGSAMANVLGTIADSLADVLDVIDRMSENPFGRIILGAAVGGTLGFVTGGVAGAGFGALGGASFQSGQELGNAYNDYKAQPMATINQNYQTIEGARAQAMAREALNIKTEVNINDNRSDISTSVNQGSRPLMQKDKVVNSPVFRTGKNTLTTQGAY